MTHPADHRSRHLSDLRRLFDRLDTAGNADDAALIQTALHYLGVDDHLAKAARVKALADPTANELVEAMLPDLLLILIERLGGQVEVSVDEIDARPKGLVMAMQVIPRVTGPAFHFVIQRRPK